MARRNRRGGRRQREEKAEKALDELQAAIWSGQMEGPRLLTQAMVDDSTMMVELTRRFLDRKRRA